MNEHLGMHEYTRRHPVPSQTEPTMKRNSISPGICCRTIAAPEGSAHIQANHVSEAVQYRLLDRKW